jgi:hypothetical protein
MTYFRLRLSYVEETIRAVLRYRIYKKEKKNLKNMQYKCIREIYNINAKHYAVKWNFHQYVSASQDKIP